MSNLPVRFPPTRVIDAVTKQAYTLCGIGMLGEAGVKVAMKIDGHTMNTLKLEKAYSQAEKAWAAYSRGAKK